MDCYYCDHGLECGNIQRKMKSQQKFGDINSQLVLGQKYMWHMIKACFTDEENISAEIRKGLKSGFSRFILGISFIAGVVVFPS
ncbi:hypothetical protein X798_01425 [Onchocerca flexuosa]|nr:hypothetical protein X798_01425 [Onchocerca flexuosa]